MGGFYFKYTNDKPYLNRNQKKKDILNVEIVEMQKDIKKKMKFILNLIGQVLIFRCNILIYLYVFFFARHTLWVHVTAFLKFSIIIISMSFFLASLLMTT